MYCEAVQGFSNFWSAFISAEEQLQENRGYRGVVTTTTTRVTVKAIRQKRVIGVTTKAKGTKVEYSNRGSKIIVIVEKAKEVGQKE